MPGHSVPGSVNSSADISSSYPTLVPLASTTIKYVSNSGNDTTGNGTQALPYATISRAFRDAPRCGATRNDVAFVARIVAPYTTATPETINLPPTVLS